MNIKDVHHHSKYCKYVIEFCKQIFILSFIFPIRNLGVSSSVHLGLLKVDILTRTQAG